MDDGHPDPRALPLDDALASRRVWVGSLTIGIVVLAVGLASSSTVLVTMGIVGIVFAWPLQLLGSAGAGRQAAVAWWPTDGPDPGRRTVIKGDATTVLVRTPGWDAVTGRHARDYVLLVERRGIRAWIHRARHDRPTLAELQLSPDGRPRSR